MFGLIGAFFGSVASFVVGSVSSAISALASSVGGVITSFAGSTVQLISSISGISLDQLGAVFDYIGTIVHALTEFLGIESEQDPTILGYKAGLSGTKIDNFDSYEEYIKYLKNEVEIDDQKFNALKAEEKFAYGSIGISLEAKAVEEKLGVEITPEFLSTMALIKLGSDVTINTKEFVSIMQGLKEHNISSTEDVVEYFEGRGESDRVSTGLKLHDIFEKIFPSSNVSDILNTIKEDIRNYNEDSVSSL